MDSSPIKNFKSDNRLLRTTLVILIALFVVFGVILTIDRYLKYDSWFSKIDKGKIFWPAGLQHYQDLLAAGKTEEAAKFKKGLEQLRIIIWAQEEMMLERKYELLLKTFPNFPYAKAAEELLKVVKQRVQNGLITK